MHQLATLSINETLGDLRWEDMQAENLDQNTLNPTTTMSSPDTCTHILTLTHGRKEDE